MLTNEITAGGLRNVTDEKKRQLAAESVTYNFKKEKQFIELFGGYFDQIGIDPVTKKAKVVAESASGAAEESK